MDKNTNNINLSHKLLKHHLIETKNTCKTSIKIKWNE